MRKFADIKDKDYYFDSEDNWIGNIYNAKDDIKSGLASIGVGSLGGFLGFQCIGSLGYLPDSNGIAPHIVIGIFGVATIALSYRTMCYGIDSVRSGYKKYKKARKK